MPAVLLGAVWAAFSWLLRAVVLKFVIYTGLFLLVSEMTQYLSGKLLAGDGGIGAALGGLPDGVWWLLNLFQFGTGMSLVIAAYLTRFAIRRLPVIG